jgi:hypothetical protein
VGILSRRILFFDICPVDAFYACACPAGHRGYKRARHWQKPARRFKCCWPDPDSAIFVYCDRAIYLIFGLEISLFLPFTLRELGGTEFHFGLQEAAEAIGIAIGSIGMARLADRIRAGQWLAISYLSMAAAMIVYSFSHSVWLAILMMGVSGLLNAPSFIGEQLVIQRAAPARNARTCE